MAQDPNQYQSLLNQSSLDVHEGDFTITGLGTDKLLYVDANNTLEPVSVGTGLTFSAPFLTTNTTDIRALISATAPVEYSSTTGVISLPQANIDHGSISGLADDDHTQYHNDARALTWLGTRSTSDLPEGTNLYYTTARVDSWLSTKTTDDLTQGTTNKYLSALTVSDALGNLTFSSPTLSLTSDPIFTTLNTNAGIGCAGEATIGYKLSVSNGVYLTTGTTYGKPAIQSVTSAFASDTLYVNPAGGDVAIGDSSSSVGIGTTPSGSYDIELPASGSAYLGSATSISSTTSAGSHYGLSNTNKTSGATWRIWNMSSAGPTSGTYGDGLGFWVYPAVAQRMMIYDNGDFKVHSGSDFMKFWVNGSAPYVEIGNGTVSSILHSYSTAGSVGTLSNHNFTLRTNNTERMLLNTSGYLGINNTAPNAYLTVGSSTQGASDISTLCKIADTTTYPLTIGNTNTQANGNEALMSFYFGSGWSATAKMGAFIENSSSAKTGLKFYTYSSGFGERMRISGDGTISINTTSTGTYQLNVNGSFNCTTLYVGGTPITGYNSAYGRIKDLAQSFNSSAIYTSFTELTSYTYAQTNNASYSGGRITPSVAGKYQITMTISHLVHTCTTAYVTYAKNGTFGASDQIITETSGATRCATLTRIESMNGSTDYVSVFVSRSNNPGVNVHTLDIELACVFIGP